MNKNPQRMHRMQMKPISFAAKLAAGATALMMPLTHAQIVADRNAPGNQRPTILETANGLPQVNIQTPSAAGVSRNTYSQFDVQRKGAILNNSRTNAQTQTGGLIQANPWLAGGAARVILNEVNSSNPSQLRGYVEIAGQKAEVIIANPAGIQVDGGGFINADRVTLTTGTAVMNPANGGSLESYRIPQGTISIDGLGLDTRTASYTDILARSVQVNAGVWANRLKVVTGANEVSTSSADYPGDVAQGVSPIAGTGPSPQFSLDVAALGGMYAGHIYLVGSESGMGVRNKGVINAGGGNLVLLSNGFLTNEGAIQATSLNGNGGNVRIDAAGSINNAGANAVISAQGVATIATAADLSNADGARVDAARSLAIVTTGSLTNAGRLGAGEAVTVRAADISNAATGEIASATTLAITTGLVTNAGKLVAGEAAIVSAANINNAATGAIEGGTTLAVTADSINNAGKLVAGEAATVSAVNINNAAAAEIAAATTLAITADSVTNAGRLIAGDALTVSTVNMNNAVTGKVTGAATTITATRNLTNRGLIDGEATLLQAGTFANIGTGRVYGDDLGIAANILSNDTETINGTRSDAVIAARERLDIGAGTLNNRNGALIFSAGTGANALNIGGGLDTQGHATGTAGTINNEAATIESLGGAVISAQQINNINPDFSTRTSTTSSAASGHYIRLGGTRYLESELGRCYKCASDRFDNGDPSFSRLEYVTPSSQYRFEDGYSRTPYQLTSRIYDEVSEGYRTVSYSYPADSPVWVLFAVPVGNQALLKSRLESYNDNLISRSYRDFDHIWVTSTQTVQTVVDNPGTPGRIIAGGGITLSGGDILNDNSQILAGGNLHISGGTLTNTETAGQRKVTDFGTFRRDTIEYSPYQHNAGAFGSGDYVFVSESVTTKLDTSRAESNASAFGTGTQLTSRVAPGSSLLRYSHDPAATHFYEIDPRFNKQQWLSSDYLLQALNTDPNTIQKRLGDGFYEQKLVREQVAELTGRRFLDGYASDEAQYQALMQAGTTYAQQWNLVPGVALTAAQMAQLTSDIVWLVAQEVLLPDGTRTMALVPQLYVMPRDGDLAVGGALLAGQNVNIQLAGDLKNSGTIAGRNVTQLNANNVQNLGTIGGKAVSVEAQQDLLNLGGRIIAEDSLIATAGRDLTVESTTSTGSASAGPSSSSITQLDRLAGLYVTKDAGVLVASAGRDLSVIAGVLSSMGNVQVTAGNDVNLRTVDTAYKSDLTANERNYMRQSGTEEMGSQIVSNGSITITTGNDINARAATVNAQGSLVVGAGGDIQLVEGRATTQNDDARYARSKNFGSSSSTESRYQSQTDTAIGSNFDGKTISLVSAGDTQIRGTSVSGSQSVTVITGNDLNITAAINTSQSSNFNESKNSGFISSKNNKSTVNTFDTQVVGSSIAGDTVSVSAGRDATIVGSHINAVNDATINAGRDVTIAAALESHDVSQTSESKRSGLSASFQSGISIGSSNGRETLDQQGQIAITSSVSGSNVKIVADRDVGVLGSAVLADKDIHIDAGRNINIDVVKEIQTAENTSKSSGTAFGLSPSLSGSLTIYGTTADKQNGQSDGQSSITSLLSANTGNLTMVAGNASTQDSTITTRGADLLAGKAIKLEADRIDLLAASNTSAGSNHSESKSFTVGAKPSGQVGGLINSAIESAMSSADGTGNNRLDNALALKAGYDTYKAIENAKKFADGLGKAAKGAANADPSGSAFGVSVSVGSASSSSNSSTATTQVTGTNLQAKSIDLTARQTDIYMEGAKLQAETIVLDAKRDVILEAAANTSEIQSTNKSSSASVGATIGIGQQSGISFQLGMQNGKGKANGSEVTYDNTLITATDKLTIKSGNDTTLQGAQLAANQVKLDVGRNLTIETLQDRSRYQSEQKSGGFGISLCIPPICYGASSVSVNMANQSIKHNYQSAQGQSGISVGDGGFDINVVKVTDLIAAAITSTADKSKNNLSTGSLNSSDLVNVQDTATKSSNFSATVSFGGDANLAGNLSQLGNDSALNLLGNAAANKALPKDGSEQSQTLSVISPANITITGSNADQNAQSQQTAEQLTSRDASTANGALANTLTLQQAAELENQLKQARLEDQAARMMGELGQKMSKDVGTFAGNKAIALFDEEDKARKAGNVALADELNAEAKKWDEGGIYRVGLHTILGGLTGGTGGALGAGVSAELIPEIANAIRALDIPEDAKQALITLAGAAVGATVGGAAGAATGLNQTVNNYLKHADIKKRREELTACKTAQCEKEVKDKYSALTISRDKELAQCGDRSAYCEGLRAEALQASKATPFEMLNPTLDDKMLAADVEVNARKAYLTSLDKLARNANQGGLPKEPSELAKAGILTQDEANFLAAYTKEKWSNYTLALLNIVVLKSSPNSVKGASAVGELPALRQAYVSEVRALEDVGLNSRAAGATPEATARMLSQMRRDLGEEYKNLTPPDELAKIYARNLEKYGDKLGPTIDYMRKVEGKTWEQIIEKAARPGGKDLGY